MGYVEHINCGFSQELVTCRVFLGEKESVSIFRIFLLVMIRCHREEDPSRFFFFFWSCMQLSEHLRIKLGKEGQESQYSVCNFSFYPSAFGIYCQSYLISLLSRDVFNSLELNHAVFFQSWRKMVPWVLGIGEI